MRLLDRPFVTDPSWCPAVTKVYNDAFHDVRLVLPLQLHLMLILCLDR